MKTIVLQSEEFPVLAFIIGRTDAEAPVLWLPDAKSQLIEKDPAARKD